MVCPAFLSALFIVVVCLDDIACLIKALTELFLYFKVLAFYTPVSWCEGGGPAHETNVGFEIEAFESSGFERVEEWMVPAQARQQVLKCGAVFEAVTAVVWIFVDTLPEAVGDDMKREVG
ncbi:MAG: hypothetical protein V3W37_10010 [Candidatus Binatia bacterium]